MSKVAIPALALLLAIQLAYVFMVVLPEHAFVNFPEGGLFVFDPETSGDARPVRRILFIGSSHTFYFRMPLMVRKLADSAHVKERYAITMYAVPGATLASLWQDSTAHSLLKQKWDDVVIEGHPSAGLTARWAKEYLTLGQQYVNLAKNAGAKSVVYIPWAIADYSDYFHRYPHFRAKRHASEGAVARLAYNNGLPMVNAARTTEKLLASHPGVPLYMTDGIHGTVEAYYMVALLFFQHFSGMGADTTDYRPPGVSRDEDAAIKYVVKQEPMSNRR